ncbi:hypothetical protein Tco_0004070 [Tanacetum coccineum]
MLPRRFKKKSVKRIVEKRVAKSLFEEYDKNKNYSNKAVDLDQQILRDCCTRDAWKCKAHHQPGPCPPRCGTCHKLGHQEGDYRTRIPVARDNSLQNVTCFGCGNHGHYMSDFPELKNRN